MIELSNIIEKSLEQLAQHLNIPIRYGWKKELAKWLKIDSALLNTWIKRKGIPKKQRQKIAERGYPEEKWYISGPVEASVEVLAGSDHGLGCTVEEAELIRGLRALDSVERIGIFLTASAKFANALKEQKDKKTRDRLKKSIKTLNKAIGDMDI